MQKGTVSAFDSPQTRFLLRLPLVPTATNFLGRKIFRLLLTVQGLGAFFLITLGVIVTRFRKARKVIWPLVFKETARAGLHLLPMFAYVSIALGLLVIGPNLVTLRLAYRAAERRRMAAHDLS